VQRRSQRSPRTRQHGHPLIRPADLVDHTTDVRRPRTLSEDHTRGQSCRDLHPTGTPYAEATESNTGSSTQTPSTRRRPPLRLAPGNLKATANYSGYETQPRAAGRTCSSPVGGSHVRALPDVSRAISRSRRRLPYHGRVGVLRAFTDAHKRTQNPCKSGNRGVRTLCPEYGRCGSGGRKMDGSQTTNALRFPGPDFGPNEPR
jgi:hypothetical protein